MLGLRIKEYMEKNGIIFTFVARSIGVTNSTFSAMLNGKRRITAEEYFSICSVLNVDLSYFVMSPQQSA